MGHTLYVKRVIRYGDKATDIGIIKVSKERSVSVEGPEVVLPSRISQVVVVGNHSNRFSSEEATE